MTQEEKREIVNTIFISLNIIILAFFVFIFSISVFDKRKIKEAYISILTAFRIIEGGGNPSPVLGGSVKAMPWEPVMDADPYFGKLVRKLGESKGIGIYKFGRYYIISMESKLLFPPGSYRLSKKGLKALKAIAEYLKPMKVWIEVDGHTDSIPFKKGRLNNLALSSLRALSVAQFLVKNGIKRSRIFAYGFGGARPIAPNNTPSGRAKNRRVDIVVVVGKKKKRIIKKVKYEEFEFSL